MARLWTHVVFLSRVAWPGAALGAFLAGILFAAYVAFHLRTGLGRGVDIAAGIILIALAVVVVGCGLAFLRLVLRTWPRRLSAAIVGSFSLLFVVVESYFDAGSGVGFRLAGVLVLLGAALGGAGLLVARRLPGMSGGRRATGWVSFAVTLATCVALAACLLRPGTDPYIALQAPADASAVPSLAAEDPARKGPHAVRSLTYGSGTDRRRPEYGSGVGLRTETVDASPLVKRLTGARARIREWYWGFGADRFPINGRVWHPDGPGPFPLVLVVHGNHQMEEYSDAGYAYLGELLASRGFIVVSVDENFLNNSWSGDLGGGEIGARGWMLLKHLAAWRRWNDTPGNPFHRRVDMERIALIGHSRGGEAATVAAAFNRLPCLPNDCSMRFDFHFSIRAIVALAPVDEAYRPADQPVPIEDVSYLVLHGTHDGDVPNFEGLRAYNRARFTDGQYRFKAAVYVYRANHGQFNTVWGDDDLMYPFSSFVLRRALLRGDEQRRVAEVFVGGFLEATLNGRREYLPMFADTRAASDWLPKTTYVSQFEDSTYRPVSEFGRSIDLTRGALAGAIQTGENLSVWRQGDFRGRGVYPFRFKTLYLGWKPPGAAGKEATPGKAPTPGKEATPGKQATPASYRIALPEATAATWGLDARSRLVFTVADTRDTSAPGDHTKVYEPIDFTVEIATADGVVSRVPLSRLFPLPPILRATMTKWPYMDHAFYQVPAEPAFQTYEMPLSMFAVAGWRPDRIREIRFVFDRTPAGTIVLNGVGFAGRPGSDT